jgi:hypothetical protein
VKTLLISPDMKQSIMDKLDHIPRPDQLSGKVIVSFEFNCRPDGSVGALYVDTHLREGLRS